MLIMVSVLIFALSLASFASFASIVHCASVCGADSGPVTRRGFISLAVSTTTTTGIPTRSSLAMRCVVALQIALARAVVASLHVLHFVVVASVLLLYVLLYPCRHASVQGQYA